MDLLSVFRTFRRHWLVALPVLLLTAVGILYALVLRPTDYEATASIALLGAPSPPKNASGEAIAQTAAGKTESPLGRFGDSSVVVNIVSKAVSTDASREQLKKQGADSRYEVGPGLSAPIADVTAIAPSPEQAIKTANLVAQAFVTQLQSIQAAQGVDPAYMVSTLPVETPDSASPKYSSSVRLAIAVLGLGVLASYFVVSVAEARRQSKAERAAARSDAAAASGPVPVAGPGSQAFTAPDPPVYALPPSESDGPDGPAGANPGPSWPKRPEQAGAEWGARTRRS